MTKENQPALVTAKKVAGSLAAEFIEEGMHVGLGTGSTSSYFIEALAARCRAGLNIYGVASSQQSARQAQSLGIPLIEADSLTHLDITVDGADEIDPHKNMIKGGGGALLREKILARSSSEMIIIIDETKLVPHLGAAPLPVEIVPFAYKTTLSRLEGKGYQGTLRLNRDFTIYQTDNGHYLVDIQFGQPIFHPKEEDEHLKSITGVIETGLFFQIAGRVIIGFEDGLTQIQT